MSDFDFNNAEPARAMGDLIPEDTVALVVINVREGGAGPGGVLKKSADQTAEMLDLEFIIDGGQYDRRRLWENWMTSGQSDGQQKAAGITRSRVRSTLESAHGLNPGDDSEPAMEKRRINGWAALDGLKICVKIGIEQGGLKDKTAGPNSERWPTKNKIKAILTPADGEYIAPGPQIGGFQHAGAVAGKVAAAAAPKAAAAVGAKPAWAS